MNRVFVITRKTIWALVVFWVFVITLSVILCLISFKAHAHSVIVGKGLSNTCNNPAEIQKVKCLSYITGVLDGISFQRGYTKGVLGESAHAKHAAALQHYCFSTGVTIGQIVLIIKEYMLDNPKVLQFTSVVLIRRALANAFPCFREIPVDFRGDALG